MSRPVTHWGRPSGYSATWRDTLADYGKLIAIGILGDFLLAGCVFVATGTGPF